MRCCRFWSCGKCFVVNNGIAQVAMEAEFFQLSYDRRVTEALNRGALTSVEVSESHQIWSTSTLFPTQTDSDFQSFNHQVLCM